MKNKGKYSEDGFFAQEDIETRHRLHKEKEEQEKKIQEKELKELHHMKCSKCGHNLQTKRLSYVDVDQCTQCGAIVLAREDIEKFVAEERSILKSFIDFFQ